jgi:hypothetical protein
LVIALLIIGIKIIVVGATELQAVKRLISKSRRFLKEAGLGSRSYWEALFQPHIDYRYLRC